MCLILLLNILEQRSLSLGLRKSLFKRYNGKTVQIYSDTMYQCYNNNRHIATHLCCFMQLKFPYIVQQFPAL